MKKKEPLQDELTAEMHFEFLGDEIPMFDFKVMGVYGQLSRGILLEKALKKYGISEREYRDNLDRVLHD